LRFTPDLQKTEIVADGFRNAYGMDFNLDGELFTFDSDNERCVSLPWYESTRFYHVMPGGHYGWQAPQRGQWWRQPPYFADVVAPVATLGRGSPTGVACYRHVQFPPAYRGGIFLLDWTFGRVYFLTLQRSGSTYTCRKQVFLESVGDNGFAPTALAVHPVTGDLFISIGGRGTRGAVYRIRYPQGLKAMQAKELARLRLRPRSLDWRPERLTDILRAAGGKDGLERRNALLAIRRHRDHLQPDRVAEVVRANWDHPDRYVRQATADLVATLTEPQRRQLAGQAKTPAPQLTLAWGSVTTDPASVLERVGPILADGKTGPRLRLEAVRLVQVALGDLMAWRSRGTLWEGYSPRRFPFWAGENGDRHPVHLGKAAFVRVVAALRAAFPSGDADLDREISRTLAVLEDDDPAVLVRVAGRLTADSDPVEDIHYLIVLARLRGSRPAALTRRTAGTLLALDRKLVQQRGNRDTHWPLRIAELYRELARKDARLHGAVLNHPEFGRPDHVLFAESAGFDRRKAAAVFLERARRDADYEWGPPLVKLIGERADERVLSVLRRLWDRGGLQEAILGVLARQPQGKDREKFVWGLGSPQPATVRLCLTALEKLPPRSEPATVLALVQALRRLPEGKEENRLAARLAHYLAKVTGQGGLGTDRQRWVAWFGKTYPALAARLGNEDGVDVAAWDKRLAALDWSAGDAGRGKGVYTRASCAACHSGAQALGPDLSGVAGRFSRADLFTAILQPSKDVSPRYRTTQVTTADGKVYQGMIIYEAVDSLILQTGPATTIRLANRQIAERRVTTASLMPAGLIDKISDRDIADLYAYLRSLGAAPAKKRMRPK
jgi:putative heme-binding domain-containing protein